MGLVVDAAREDFAQAAHNTTYQKGNSTNTSKAGGASAPAWLDTIDFFAATTVELHITARNDLTPWVGIDNTLDDWLPHQTTQFIPLA